MRKARTFRGSLVRALMVSMLAGWSGAMGAQWHAGTAFRRSPLYAMAVTRQNTEYGGQEQGGVPFQRPPANMGGQTHLVGPDGRRGGQHLPEWMSQHKGMTLQQQQQALDREPGFRDLPVQTQVQMHQRLAVLNAMTPEKLARTLAHTEAMERLNPMQRGQVRGAMQQLGSLPIDERRMVMRSFRELRTLPPDQRMGMLNSPRYGWMNYAQKTVLTNLIQVAPLLPSD